MIKVSGQVKVSASYGIELDMTEEAFDALSEKAQQELLENSIDWRDVLQSSETDEIEVWELDEEEEVNVDADAEMA